MRLNRSWRRFENRLFRLPPPARGLLAYLQLLGDRQDVSGAVPWTSLDAFAAAHAGPHALATPGARDESLAGSCPSGVSHNSTWTLPVDTPSLLGHVAHHLQPTVVMLNMRHWVFRHDDYLGPWWGRVAAAARPLLRAGVAIYWRMTPSFADVPSLAEPPARAKLSALFRSHGWRTFDAIGAVREHASRTGDGQLFNAKDGLHLTVAANRAVACALAREVCWRARRRT